jgi:Chalcone isomerase-like
MKKLFIISLFFLLQFIDVNGQNNFEIEGVSVPRSIDFDGTKLELNGYGVRSKAWIEVYVQALYLAKLSGDAQEIINAESPMAIRLQITSDMVTSKKLSKSLNKGLEKSIGEDGMHKLSKEISELEVLLNLEETKFNDAFNLYYNPIDSSIWIYKNDKLRGKIKGMEFKKALFGIWLSENPVDKDLKQQLLGY